MTTNIIPEDLLSILACPASLQPLRLANNVELQSLLKASQEGTLVKIDGSRASEPFEGALVREDAQLAYRITSGIPVLLVEEAIRLN